MPLMIDKGGWRNVAAYIQRRYVLYHFTIRHSQVFEEQYKTHVLCMNIILFGYQYAYVFMMHSSAFLFIHEEAGKKNK